MPPCLAEPRQKRAGSRVDPAFRGNVRVAQRTPTRPIDTSRPDGHRRPGPSARPRCPTTLPFSGLAPSVSEDQVRCNGGFGSHFGTRALRAH
jgi:hypothetical protein